MKFCVSCCAGKHIVLPGTTSNAESDTCVPAGVEDVKGGVVANMAPAGTVDCGISVLSVMTCKEGAAGVGKSVAVTEAWGSKLPPRVGVPGTPSSSLWSMPSWASGLVAFGFQASCSDSEGICAPDRPDSWKKQIRSRKSVQFSKE